MNYRRDGAIFLEHTPLSLPHMMQSKTAEEQSDLSSAKEYLIAAYKRKDPKVMLLLREINCKTAVYKASCDNGRFPDFRYFSHCAAISEE